MTGVSSIGGEWRDTGDSVIKDEDICAHEDSVAASRIAHSSPKLSHISPPSPYTIPYDPADPAVGKKKNKLSDKKTRRVLAAAHGC